MNDTSGHLFEMPLTSLDQGEQSLKMLEGTCRWDSRKSSWILPTSGTMRNGVLSLRPTLEPLTGAIDSSLLPTPTARDHKEQTLGWTWERGGVVQEDTVPRAVTALMPTPTVVDMGNNKTPEEWKDWKDALRAKHNNGNGHGESLTQAAINWKKYEPAIRHWEFVTKTPAPAPTVPHGERVRVNPVFVEWMMGLPKGRVTGHGMKPAKELQLLGNGVVPRQASHAVLQLERRIRP